VSVSVYEHVCPKDCKFDHIKKKICCVFYANYTSFHYAPFAHVNKQFKKKRKKEKKNL